MNESNKTIMSITYLITRRFSDAAFFGLVKISLNFTEDFQHIIGKNAYFLILYRIKRSPKKDEFSIQFSFNHSASISSCVRIISQTNFTKHFNSEYKKLIKFLLDFYKKMNYN